MIEPELRLVHLQVTRRCNLKCYFCGQWGENGFMRRQGEAVREMAAKDWQRVIDSIALCAEKRGVAPEVVVWGGEPLLHEGVDDILRQLRSHSLRTRLVTNGVLLDRHLDAVNECVDELFVSLDGPRELHEKTRGVKGIYDAITANLSRVDTSRVNTTCMCTINELNCRVIEDFPYELARHNFKSVLYQNLIFLSPRDAACYKEWVAAVFGTEATHTEAWVKDGFGSYIDELPQIFARMENLVRQKQYPIGVEIFPPEVNSRTVRDYYLCADGVPADKEEDNYCWTPFRHMNISCAGKVHPCVDFDDVAVGDVRDETIEEIFFGPAFQKFREQISRNQNPACKRCPWKYNKFSG